MAAATADRTEPSSLTSSRDPDSPIGRPDLPGNLDRLRLVEVGNDHAGALRNQLFGDGSADPAAQRRSPRRSARRGAPASAFAGSLASSRAQYSMRNFSDSGIGV